MRITLALLLLSISLHAHNFSPISTLNIQEIAQRACSLDHDTYTHVGAKQKLEYAHSLAHALRKGIISQDEITSKAVPSLRYDTARRYYLLFGEHIDLQTATPSFSLRALMEHGRFNRSVNEQGELDLSYLHLADLDGIDDVPHIQTVQTLNMSHNSISRMTPHNFQSLTYLKKLDLSFNKITGLRANIFKHMGHLVSLNVSHNYISHLDKDTFGGLYALQNLDISYNKLEWIGIGAFHDLTHTKSVNISNNQLYLISPRVLNPLTHVKKLNLSHNQFNIIHSHVLHALRHLEQLDLSNNQLKRITSDSLYGLKRLEVLNLRNNDIVIVDLHTPHFLPKLTTIVLGNNPIKNKRLAAIRTQLPNVKILKNDPPRTTKTITRTTA